MKYQCDIVGCNEPAEYVDQGDNKLCEDCMAKEIEGGTYEPEDFERLDETFPFMDQKPEYEDGKPCDHPGCLANKSHPCEGCGRIGGRSA